MPRINWRKQAKRAIANGFKLIPLHYAQKRPLVENWTSFIMGEEDVEAFGYGGFGVLYGVGEHPIYAFDVDTTDQKIADEFSSSFEILHGTPLVRVGQKPKILIPFRMKEAEHKKKKSPERHQGHLDILGCGQQFVAYNIHPDTGEEYTWTTPLHGIKAENLPLLSEADVDHMFDFFQSLTTPKVKENKKTQPAKEWKNNHNNRHYTNREIRAFLSCFGEEFTNGSHDEWIPIVMAVHHETRGSDNGKEIARRWSKQGVTYDEQNLNYKWGTFDFEENGDESKKRSTFASLFYHHRKLIPDGLLEERFSDAYNKEMFSVCKAGRFLYASDTKVWYKKDKNNRYIWRITDDKIAGYIMEFLISMKRDAFDLCEELEHKEGIPKKPRALYLKAYAKRNACEQSRSKSTANALEAKSRFHISSEQFDSHWRYMGEQDGVLDLETGQRVIPTEELYITKSTGTPYVKGEPSKEFMDLVSSYFESEELMNFFIRCVGMALLGGNEAHKIVNLLGIGRSGKSTLIKLLQHAFGMQYITHLQFEDIMSAYDGGGGSPSPSIISAFGSRIAVINETNENAPLNEAMVKAITGGDMIAARLLYSNNIIRKKAGFTPFIVTNKALFIRSTDNSIWERLVIIPFKKRVENIDPTLEGRLKEYALDAKRWFLRGVQDYIQRGHRLDIPEICVRAVEEERYELDTVQKWIDDYCEIGFNLFEKYSVLIDSYNNYLREEEKSRISVKTTTLIKNLTQKGFVKDRINEGKGSDRRRIRGIKGIRLKSQFEAIEDEPSNVIDFKGKGD